MGTLDDLTNSIMKGEKMKNVEIVDKSEKIIAMEIEMEGGERYIVFLEQENGK